MKFQITLQELRRISPTALDQTCRATRGALGTVEWKMGLCLLAWSRRPELRDMGYSSVYDYGERALNLCGRKVSELLGAARALEHLPKLSEAFRTGAIGWSKVRVLHGLATPETEELWIDFASKHRSEEVARKVTLSPTEWKHHRALRASLKQQPIASESAVEKILSDNDLSPKSDACPKRTNSSPPPAPKTIRLVVNLTPDEYALYEQAENRIRAKSQGRLSRAKVITKMAEQILSHGSARARCKHQVIIHTVEGREGAWYDTDRGLLPVSPNILKEVLSPDRSKDHTCDLNRCKDAGGSECSEVQATRRTKTKSSRSYIPTSIVRALYRRANNRCERCKSRKGPLHIHHTIPVSEGGDNQLSKLKLLCASCHGLEHRDDFHEKPSWRRARDGRSLSGTVPKTQKIENCSLSDGSNQGQDPDTS